MIGALARYARWLHTRWPAGRVEPFPRVGADGRTDVPGVFVAGDLGGVPLLKFALDSGARTARAIAAELARAGAPPRIPGEPDLVIVGAGVSGLAAAIEAKRLGLEARVLEASEPLFTLVNFPVAKPIFTYPLAMRPEGALQVSATVKEALIDELRAQVAAAGVEVSPGRVERVEPRQGRVTARLEGGGSVGARRALIAIGRSGDFRRLGVPGESLPKVFNRLHDPADFAGRRALVVGGGDAAVETALALAESGAEVTLVHRGDDVARARPENMARLERASGEAGSGRLAVRTATRVREIHAGDVVLEGPGGAESLGNDVVFTMIGREPPLGFLRRSGIGIAGQWSPRRMAGLALFLAFCAWLYDWKSGGSFSSLWYARHWFPVNLPDLLAQAGGSIASAAKDRRSVLGILAISASSPSFLYTLAYSIVVTGFGLRRIRRRRTPYVTAQTLTLMCIQIVPLFLLPELILPWLDARGWLPRALADALFPVVSYGHGREFWRAYGLILAWPLDVYNLFTHDPLPWWIAIGFVQTCVLIPLAVYFFGKGAYCGWVCSCGALAETLGDRHRDKMPHGPGWNRLNLAGQGVLAIAVVLMMVRVAGWLLPRGNPAERLFESLLEPGYKWGVDVFLAGVLGYGVYFWFSGRFWCRFFCPLAALMHVYARFGRFRILAEKKKCISCGQCTAICHQGIDVMSFANRGLPMADPECVRCSACVHVCPTGVLQFGQVDRTGRLISVDSLAASPVLMRESER
jgi:thioredoxin reductase/NAD-dependent dihydropyrimidine dehydrogenase PreA subunit